MTDHGVRIAESLNARHEEILRLWESAVRKELTPAQHQSKPALWDEVPTFLTQLEKTIIEGTTQAYLADRKAIAEHHAWERAGYSNFTLEQILIE